MQGVNALAVVSPAALESEGEDVCVQWHGWS
jgi:hypothetical protein